MANEYVNKVVLGSSTLIDLTADTVTPSTLMQGYTAHDASGAPITGTNTGGGTEAGTVTQDAQGYLVLDDEEPSGRVTVEALSVTQNGTYTAQTGKAYSPVTVSVGNSYTSSDEGKVVSNGALVAQTAMASSITANGTYDTTTNNSVTVNVSGGGGGGLEYETGTWTPTEDVNDYTIPFANTHSTPPAYFSVVNDEYDDTLNSNLALSYVNWERMLGADIYSSSDTARSAIALYTYRSTSTTSVSNGTSNVLVGSSDAWATSTGVRAYGGSTSRYWRSTCTYKWIAIWAPTS